MAIEKIDQPNPPPLPSQLPREVAMLAKDLHVEQLDPLTMEAVTAYRRAADYIAAAMIFLKDNTLMERDLEPDDFKHRLLGHWGTCPGLSLVFAHLNLVIQKYSQNMICLVGPGHGAPAILACLWLERSLERFYPQYTRDRKGLHNLISNFSLPGGFPSHANAQVPGTLHEGGELGYALAVAYGTVMDQPDLITVAIIGDGEAETGPTAAAWHVCKYIDPKESGAVIPILHVNGFKTSERTISGCMDNQELIALFTGYGYRPCVVDILEDLDSHLHAAMSWCIEEIYHIQRSARLGAPINKPRWPMIILRTPKGLGAPKRWRGEWIEGSFRAHQVPLPDAKTDSGERTALQEWLLAYKPSESFPDGKINDSIKGILPVHDKLRIGQNPVFWKTRDVLDVPKWKHFARAKASEYSCTRAAGELLTEAIARNQKSLRLFSPDELVSNKLDKVFDVTSRNFQWDQYSMHHGGQVTEILSQHICQGLMQGYTMTGRTSVFPTYESFLPIVNTMMVQYSKFLKISKEIPWRRDVNSLNYISTSTWTRQEHNGLSHQNPGFIGDVLALKPFIARVYLPPDPNTFLSTLAHCLRSKNYINLIVGSKHSQPVWLSAEEAEAHCKAGGSIWKFASTDSGIDPDVVLVGIGADLMFEVIYAASYLRKIAPALAVRVVNVTDLMILGHEGSHPHALTHQDFDALFTPHRRIHFNYHGYANELQGLLFGRPQLSRVTIESYSEEGTTTTPLDMLIRNRCSRFHVAEAAVRAGAQCNPHVAIDLQKLVTHIGHDMEQTRKYIQMNGIDPEDTFSVPIFIEHHDGERRLLPTRSRTRSISDGVVIDGGHGHDSGNDKGWKSHDSEFHF